MNAIAGFRKCTLTDKELITAVDSATDKLFESADKGKYEPPTF